MLMERSRVTWGTTEILYSIRRSSRRATVSLMVDPEVGLLVTAPKETSIPKLDSVVKTRAKWVVEHLHQSRDREAPPAVREFVSGESFLYLGRQFRLRLIPSDHAGPVALHGGFLDLPMPRGLVGEERSAYTGAALIAWYKRRAEERFPAWVAPWGEKLGVVVEGVRITEQAKRWGSYSSGVLRFNWRIIQAPRTLVDYVLAHEVVHIVHEHHGRAFWATLGRLMPDYEVKKDRLKELGPSLIW